MIAPPVTPILFTPSLESIEENEHELIQELVATLRKISEKTYADSGHAMRSVHAKAHGIINGELTVFDDLPQCLAQGMFAKPGVFPVIMRLSTTPGDKLDDSVSTPRGLALKIIGAEGPRLPGSEGEMTQDLVLVDGPAFNASNIKAFLRSLKLLAATTDRAEGFKKGLSAALRGVEALVEKAGGKSGTLIGLGGHPETHILGETFYSQTPFLYGEYVAKFQIAPTSNALMSLRDAPVDMADRPNALRECVSEHFETLGGEWELRVQLLTNLETMPIEDASVPWPEAESPYIAVGRITAPPQRTFSETSDLASDQKLAFSPWHGLAAHRPLGSINRARKPTYDMSKHFRAEHGDTSPASERALAGD